MSLSDIIVNYNDIDPISLEKIKDLPSNKLFFLTNKKTNKKYAYDAINWFIHISNDKRHPITRNKLSNQELWNLYLTTIREYDTILDIDLLQLINKSLNLYHSKKIKLKKEDNKIMVVPVSPLFNLKIKKLNLISKNDVTKEYNLIYQLMESRNHNSLVCDNLSVIIKMPEKLFISFGF